MSQLGSHRRLRPRGSVMRRHHNLRRRSCRRRRRCREIEGRVGVLPSPSHSVSPSPSRSASLGSATPLQSLSVTPSQTEARGECCCRRRHSPRRSSSSHHRRCHWPSDRHPRRRNRHHFGVSPSPSASAMLASTHPSQLSSLSPAQVRGARVSASVSSQSPRKWKRHRHRSSLCSGWDRCRRNRHRMGAPSPSLSSAVTSGLKSLQSPARYCFRPDRRRAGCRGRAVVTVKFRAVDPEQRRVEGPSPSLSKASSRSLSI